MQSEVDYNVFVDSRIPDQYALIGNFHKSGRRAFVFSKWVFDPQPRRPVCEWMRDFCVLVKGAFGVAKLCEDAGIHCRIAVQFFGEEALIDFFGLDGFFR